MNARAGPGWLRRLRKNVGNTAAKAMAASSSTVCGACTRGTDNKAWGCPPRMADGRLFTDYRPRCDANLQFAAPMSGSHEYRQFLIHNGQNIIDASRSAAATVAACGPCVSPLGRGTMAPELDRVVCDKVSCSRVRVRAPGAGGEDGGAGIPGIGTGREYGMTPEARAQESEFMGALQQQQQQLAQRGQNCCGCASAAQGDFGARYPGVAAVAPGPARWAAPGGGTPMAGGDPASGSACPLA
jgi:hypothetical protein